LEEADAVAVQALADGVLAPAPLDHPVVPNGVFETVRGVLVEIVAMLERKGMAAIP
jgi:hypothetical protein